MNVATITDTIVEVLVIRNLLWVMTWKGRLMRGL